MRPGDRQIDLRYPHCTRLDGCTADEHADGCPGALLVVPTLYQFEAYTYSHVETWGLAIPAGKIATADRGCYLSVDLDPGMILRATHGRWGTLQRVGRMIDREANQAFAVLTIDGIDYRLAHDRDVWMGLNEDGPEHLKRGGFTR